MNALERRLAALEGRDGTANIGALLDYLDGEPLKAEPTPELIEAINALSED